MYFVCCQHRWQSVNTSDVLNVFEKSTIVCKHMGWLQFWVLRVPQTCIRSKAAQQVSLYRFTHYQKERLQPTVYLVQIKIKSNILFWQNPERKIGNEWVLSRNQLRGVSLKWSFNNEIYVSFPLRAHTQTHGAVWRGWCRKMSCISSASLMSEAGRNIRCSLVCTRISVDLTSERPTKETMAEIRLALLVSCHTVYLLTN